MIQLGPFHHPLTMRLTFYIVYSLTEWQVHTQECFYTLVSISGINDIIHHLPSSPSWDLQCTAQMFVPLGGWIGHFYVSFSLSCCITICGALNILVSGQNSTQYTLTWVMLLVMLVEG